MLTDLIHRLETAPGNDRALCLVSDAQVDALVAKGWDWHSAYRHLQAVAHGNAFASACLKALEQNNG